MKAYEPALSFDEDSAKRHDERGDETAAVGFLESLAGEGPVLELAIGTGRLALPLAARAASGESSDRRTIGSAGAPAASRWSEMPAASSSRLRV